MKQRDKRSKLTVDDLKHLKATISTEKDNPLFEEHPWLRDIPNEIRKGAIDDQVANWKTTIENAFASKKDPLDWIHFHKKSDYYSFSFHTDPNTSVGHHKTFRLYPGSNDMKRLPKDKRDVRYYGGLRTMGFDDWKHYTPRNKAGRYLLPSIPSKIHKDRWGDFWLIVTYQRRAKEKTMPTKPVVAIDPGVRTPLTCFSSDNHFELLGKGFPDAMMTLLVKIDRLRSLMDTTPRGPRWELYRRQKNAAWKRLENLKRDFKVRVSQYLTDNYSCIILPKLETKRLVLRDQPGDGNVRKLKTKTVRMMCSVGHCDLYNKIHILGTEKGVHVMKDVSERYTSRTCSQCGHVRTSFSSETFRCPKCKFTYHRDAHSAYLIMRKHLYIPE